NGTTYDDEWCVTSQGILGLVKQSGSNSSDNSSFEIQSLNTNPSESIFKPPSGATVTTSPT
ncbi:MAG TPA: hypothetical protein VME46_03360, partial [Acidimicrobiales bacterium]|nr:hypothetical protein [Acidimicrobiales bacterium]